MRHLLIAVVLVMPCFARLHAEDRKNVEQTAVEMAIASYVAAFNMVDRQTQRAAWKFADDKNTEIVMETAISNLTKDDSSALVHFGPTQTQTKLLVRLPAPEEDPK